MPIFSLTTIFITLQISLNWWFLMVVKISQVSGENRKKCYMTSCVRVCSCCKFTEALGKWVKGSLLVERLHQASYFSIMADECSDVASIEEISAYCRWESSMYCICNYSSQLYKVFSTMCTLQSKQNPFNQSSNCLIYLS